MESEERLKTTRGAVSERTTPLIINQMRLPMFDGITSLEKDRMAEGETSLMAGLINKGVNSI